MKLKFRGQCVEDGVFIYGDFFQVESESRFGDNPIMSKSYIKEVTDDLDIKTLLSGSKIRIFANINQVADETIGQFTGLKDKYGKDIYEGDILSHIYGFGNGKGVVQYWAPMWKLGINRQTCDEISFPECEIIGNIHENKDLLK